MSSWFLISEIKKKLLDWRVAVRWLKEKMIDVHGRLQNVNKQYIKQVKPYLRVHTVSYAESLINMKTVTYSLKTSQLYRPFYNIHCKKLRHVKFCYCLHVADAYIAINRKMRFVLPRKLYFANTRILVIWLPMRSSKIMSSILTSRMINSFLHPKMAVTRLQNDYSMLTL